MSNAHTHRISNIHKGLRSTANLHHKLWQKKLQNQCKRNKYYQKNMSEKKKVVDTEQKTFLISTDVSNDTRLNIKIYYLFSKGPTLHIAMITLLVVINDKMYVW